MFRNRFFLSAVGFSSFTLSSGSIYSSTKLYSSSNTNNDDNEEFENTNEASSSTSRKSNTSSSAATSTYSEKFEEFLLPTTALVQLYDYKSPRRRFVTLTFGADGFHLQNMVEGIRRDLKNQIALNKAISANNNNNKREKWNIKQTKQRSIVLDCTSIDGRDNGDTEMADVLTTSLMQRVINHVELFGYSLAKAYVTLTPDDRPVASRERLMYHYLLFRRDGIQMSLEDQEQQQENGVAEGNAYDHERLAYREEKNHNNNNTIGGNDEDAATNSSASLEEQEENSIDSVSSLKTLNELLRQHQQRKQLQDPSAPVEEQLEEKSAQQGHQNEGEEDEDVSVTRSDEHHAEAEIDDDVTITIDGREVNYDENKLEAENNMNVNDSVSKRRSVYSSFNRIQEDEEVHHETIQQQQQHSEATLESSASIETENFSASLESSQEEQQPQTAASSLPIAMEFPDADPKAATEEIQDSFSKQANNEQEQLLAEISTQNQTQNNNINNYDEEVIAASPSFVSNDFASALLENQKEFEEMSFVKPGPDETKFASESEHNNEELQQQQQQQESEALSTSSFDDVAEEGEIVGSAASESAESLQAHEPIAPVEADDILNIFASSLDASSFVIPTPTTSRQVSVADENMKNQKLIHESSLAEDNDVASSVISAPAEHKRRGRGKGRRVKNDKKNSNQNQDQLSSEIPSESAAATSPSTTTTTSEATIAAAESDHETSEVAASEEAETKQQQHNEIAEVTENHQEGQVADLSAAASLPFVADPRRPGGDGVKSVSEVQEPEQVEKVEAQQQQQEEDDVDSYDSSLEDIFGSSMDLSESPTIKARQQNDQHQSVKENKTVESSASSATTEQQQQQQQQQQATDQFYAWYGEASAQQMY